MCTLVVWQNCWRDTPVLVASNRDENIYRASQAPVSQLRGEHRIVAPRDKKAGGTWIGTNDGGVFAGITNRFGVPPDLRRKSRGALVLRALEACSAHDGVLGILDLNPQDYNPFHLVVCDRTQGWVVWSDGETFYDLSLARGMHIVTERSFSSFETAREGYLQKQFAPTFDSPVAPSNEELEAVLRQHDDVGFDGVCVHVPQMEYGTRSSAILRLGEGDGAFQWRWAGDAPCKVSFENLDVGSLVEV